MYSPTHRESKKRGKYGRPCDRCAARRIRCVTSQDSTFCTGCLNSNERCTRDRIRKKSGPKHGRRSRSAALTTNDFCDQGFSGENEINDSPEHLPNVQLVDQAQYLEIKKEPGHSRNTFDLPQLFALSPSGPSMSGFIDTRSFGYQPNNLASTEGPELHTPLPPYHFMSTVPQQNVGSSQYMNQTRPVPLSYPSHFHPPDPIPTQVFSHLQTHQEIIHQQDQAQLSQICPQIPDESQPEHSAHMNMHTPEDQDDLFAAFKTNLSPYIARITSDCLFSQVHIYQTWFYGYWPVLSVAELLQKIQNGAVSSTPYDRITLNEKNAMPYALCCAVCAAITTQLSFVSSENSAVNQSSVSDVEYAMEAKRVRDLFNYTDKIEVETLLSSFFLYVHHTNQKGKNQQAKVYLRESITMSQILGFHEESSYREKSSTEAHNWRKIYYMLLVTERYVCFEEGLPVILDPSIKFPTLGHENHPELLVGFSELIQIFSVPSKEFFFEMNQKRLDDIGDERSVDEKKQWILAVQERLGESKQLPDNVPNPHKLNIMLSKAWIRAIACHITWNNGLLRPSVNANDCFGFDFPITNAREFLLETSYLPDMAFETNGPGICVKLLEMARSLSFTVQQSRDRLAGLTVLESLFGLVNKFKNDVTLPVKVYQGVANLIAHHKLKVVPRLIDSHEGGYMSQGYSTGTIEELIEDKVIQNAETNSKEEYVPEEFSPFSRDLRDPSMRLSASVSNFLGMSYPQMSSTVHEES